jgi:hypothetical protein
MMTYHSVASLFLRLLSLSKKVGNEAELEEATPRKEAYALKRLVLVTS